MSINCTHAKCKNYHECQLEIRTEYWPKPIPLRQFDWTAVTDDYEYMAYGINGKIGYGRTEQKAVEDLKAQADD